ncbi:hypothetical protein [Fuerstiella marisgermanici]|uniref:Uncharacterized protein n=1 Tax=Fuerstiella marisgermanici TaxID=1891926 RepID=A0A1P8W8Z9_9PLAN|nr:hypothetical protein [Fuerstiella marisgermanici]APZ90543.1 hypothetical protein Fuma_00122 [Fuerstiella marisgermanici]
MKHDMEEIVQAISLISNWLRDESKYPRSVKPAEESSRYLGIRELSIAFMEWQFRRVSQAEQEHPPTDVRVSNRVLQLLEKAAEAHQQCISVGDGGNDDA